MFSYDYVSFYGSLHECPYKKRLPDCPVKPLDNKTFEEKYEWFVSLPKQEKDALATHHQQCSTKRGLPKN